MSSYSCVTARLTMRSVLQTHGDNRSRSGPLIRLVPRPSMAPMLLAMASTHKHLYASTYTLPPGRSPRLGIRIGSADVPRSRRYGRDYSRQRRQGETPDARTAPNGDHDARG